MHKKFILVHNSLKSISIYLVEPSMLPLEILENTAYNPMIYIPFFIVILIDKRGVREAERERERENDTNT